MGKIGLVIIFAPAIGPTIAGLVLISFHGTSFLVKPTVFSPCIFHRITICPECQRSKSSEIRHIVDHALDNWFWWYRVRL